MIKSRTKHSNGRPKEVDKHAVRCPGCGAKITITPCRLCQDEKHWEARRILSLNK